MNNISDIELILEKCRSSILQNEDEDRYDSVKARLLDLDGTIKPLIQQLYYKYGYLWTNQRIYEEALKIFKLSFPADKAKAYAKYFRYRWGMFVDHTKRSNKYAEVLGRIRPVTVVTPTHLSLNYTESKYTQSIHDLAKRSVNVAPYVYHFETIRKTRYELNQVQADRRVNMFMHPLLVALGSLRSRGFENRLVRTDVARVVSNQLLRKPIRTKPDGNLYHDLTTLPVANLCSMSQMEDLYKRAVIHTLLKNEIHMFRTGDVKHSSQDFIDAVLDCNSKKTSHATLLQASEPQDNPVDMIRKITNALCFYPTVISRTGTNVGSLVRTYRVPYLNVTLPRPGDTRYHAIAEKFVNGEPVYPLTPDRVHLANPKFSKVQQMRIEASDALIFVVDRRIREHVHAPSPFDKPTRKPFKVNTSKVHVPETISIGVKKTKYRLAAVVALENEAVFSGYVAYLNSATAVSGEVFMSGGALQTKGINDDSKKEDAIDNTGHGSRDEYTGDQNETKVMQSDEMEVKDITNPIHESYDDDKTQKSIPMRILETLLSPFIQLVSFFETKAGFNKEQFYEKISTVANVPRDIFNKTWASISARYQRALVIGQMLLPNSYLQFLIGIISAWSVLKLFAINGIRFKGKLSLLNVIFDFSQYIIDFVLKDIHIFTLVMFVSTWINDSYISDHTITMKFKVEFIRCFFNENNCSTMIKNLKNSTINQLIESNNEQELLKMMEQLTQKERYVAVLYSEEILMKIRGKQMKKKLNLASTAWFIRNVGQVIKKRNNESKIKDAFLKFLKVILKNIYAIVLNALVLISINRYRSVELKGTLVILSMINMIWVVKYYIRDIISHCISGINITQGGAKTTEPSILNFLNIGDKIQKLKGVVTTVVKKYNHYFVTYKNLFNKTFNNFVEQYVKQYTETIYKKLKDSYSDLEDTVIDNVNLIVYKSRETIAFIQEYFGEPNLSDLDFAYVGENFGGGGMQQGGMNRQNSAIVGALVFAALLGLKYYPDVVPASVRSVLSYVPFANQMLPSPLSSPQTSKHPASSWVKYSPLDKYKQYSGLVFEDVSYGAVEEHMSKYGSIYIYEK